MPYPAKTSADAILEAALVLLDEGCEGALTMRRLATQLGVQPSSLYRHYPDREALERALADEAARRLHGVLKDAAADHAPAKALERLTVAYVAFARDQRTLYTLLTRPRPPQTSGPGPGKDLWNFLLGRVGALTGDPDDTAAAVALWSLLHGFVALERAGLFGLSGPREGLRRGIRAMLAGLEAGSAAS